MQGILGYLIDIIRDVNILEGLSVPRGCSARLETCTGLRKVALKISLAFVLCVFVSVALLRGCTLVLLTC
jgi:hypothetical protein